MCALIGVPIALMVARGSQLDDQLIGDSNFTRIASQAGGFGDQPGVFGVGLALAAKPVSASHALSASTTVAGVQRSRTPGWRAGT